jgi:hypothetical protein
MRRIFPLLMTFAATLALAGPARAQYQRYGFIAAGPGGAPQARELNSQFTVAAGFVARFGRPVGVNVGIRTLTAYSRLKPTEPGIASSFVVTETGLDGMAGYDTGFLGGYGWGGIHYYHESHNDEVLNTPGGSYTATRHFDDLGPSYGAGVQLRVVPRVLVFGEWFRGGGFNDRMLRLEGVRVGVAGVF